MFIEFIQKNWIELTGASIGLLYLYYEYKASILIWGVGILMSAFYIYVFIDAKFYAFAGINIYYIFAAIYGWIKWAKRSVSGDNPQIVYMPRKLFLPVSAITVLVFAVISFILLKFTDSPVAYGDSFVTTLSIIAVWMLAHKFVEQWLLLILVNIVSVILYLWQGLYPTSIMYLVYSIVSVFGYINWTKMIQDKKSNLDENI